MSERLYIPYEGDGTGSRVVCQMDGEAAFDVIMVKSDARGNRDEESRVGFATYIAALLNEHERGEWVKKVGGAWGTGGAKETEG